MENPDENSEIQDIQPSRNVIRYEYDMEYNVAKIKVITPLYHMDKGHLFVDWSNAKLKLHDKGMC